MKPGDLVRIRNGSQAATVWGIPANVVGTVVSAYTIPASVFEPARNCLDVDFGPAGVIWGEPDTEFEPASTSEQPQRKGASQ